VAIASILYKNANTDGSLRMAKRICQYCGWQIPVGDWENTFNAKPICDDCYMDMAIQHNKDEGIAV